MEAYQIRYMQEYAELTKRYMKLNAILEKADSGTLDFTLNCPLELLKEQADVMWRYIEILFERASYENVDLVKIGKGATYS